MAIFWSGASLGGRAFCASYTARMEEEVAEDDVEMSDGPDAVVYTSNPMDLDDDEDLYGPSTDVDKIATDGASNGVFDSYGDAPLCAARNGDRQVPELVAATGAGHLSSLHFFQRDMPTWSKRKLHAIGGGRGMLPIRPAVKSNITITTRIPGVTLGAALRIVQLAIYEAVVIAPPTDPFAQTSTLLVKFVQSPVEWMPDVQLDAHLPSRSVPCSRPYSSIVLDASTSLIVAILSLMESMYIFEVIEVVSDASTNVKRWWRFKLLCRDVRGTTGYLVSSMSQKELAFAMMP
ncbi:hypothetical protein C8Q74DRAFT_1452340 [Fomes fomentarius]|nr:hypothetical protein C8Q74DRAFT_1452340 [Fomes fomentarius]